METSVNSVWLKLISVGSLLFTSFTWAETEHADVGSWSFGVNLGLGQRSTFITGQDDVNIFVLPDVHYYGEQLFFDNGTLGYTLKETENHVFSAITELNPYGLYFEQSALGESFNPLFLVDQGAQVSSELFEDESRVVTESPIDAENANNSFDQGSDYPSYSLPKPDLSLDLGMQHNWFINESQNVTIKLVADVTNRHSGFRGKFTWSTKHQIEAVRLKLNLGFDWLDSKSSNYYFGLVPTIAELENDKYELGSTINPYLSLTASIPLSEKMSLVSHVKYLKFDTDINHSPVTSKGYSLTHFAGIHYKFW